MKSVKSTKGHDTTTACSSQKPQDIEEILQNTTRSS